MKAARITKQIPRTFDPVTVQITFDSLGELQNLCHRVNFSDYTLQKLPTSLDMPFPEVNTSPLFSVLKKAVIENT